MFDVKSADDGRIIFSGRLDASQVDRARAALSGVTETCVLDFGDLEYVSSLGLGVLLEAQKRLNGLGHGLVLTGLNSHLTDLFRLAGFDRVFEIR